MLRWLVVLQTSCTAIGAWSGGGHAHEHNATRSKAIASGRLVNDPGEKSVLAGTIGGAALGLLIDVALIVTFVNVSAEDDQ